MSRFLFRSRRFLLALSLPVLAGVAACSGGGGDVPSGGTSSGASSSGTSGSSGPETSASGESKGGSSASAGPSGKTCTGTGDCANWFCDCNDGAVVNSSRCGNGTCQGPSAHCEQACNTFNHKGWAGTAGGGDASNPPAKSPPAGACMSKSQCVQFQCGCTDGSRLAVRDCFKGVCSDAASGCQSACSDDGRGDWDGT